MNSEEAARAMDDTADWAIAHVQRPRPVAPDAEVADRYGALQQSLAHYRGSNAVARMRVPMSRADLVIEGTVNGSRTVSEVGQLRAEVRRLCNEIDNLSNPDVSPAAAACGETWAYVDVRGDADLGNALVRCFYDIDPDSGDPEIRATYIGGFDIGFGLLQSVADDLEKAMRAELEIIAAGERDNAAIAALEDRK